MTQGAASLQPALAVAEGEEEGEEVMEAIADLLADLDGRPEKDYISLYTRPPARYHGLPLLGGCGN